ncbi:histidinol dehydrogenase [unidentified eubacterium SCB49]|nr:histidinol dehydrogenase [unidentified eubacterium SCB49]
MKNYKNPSNTTWASLCKRPIADNKAIVPAVAKILDTVKKGGDKALLDYTQRFDKATLNELKVTAQEISEASKNVSNELKEAIKIAKSNITAFHKAQALAPQKIETTKGVTCWQESRAISKVGLYIPGGSAPLFSTVLMLGIPATIAGCNEIILCSPPDSEGAINPAILYTAQLIGIKNIFKIGGAQAIAAMAYGTESVPQVYKIFGPGNSYVTTAKQQVQQEGVAIDMPAGPSEVLVIADETGLPAFIASDLLSQAEHGPDSQVVLVSNNERIASETLAELKIQLAALPRKEIATKALENSTSFVFETIDQCINFSNQYAPEHLILASDNTDNWLSQIENAGSVFIGNYSCESAGDYASGTNHTLPTAGFAKNYSGVTLGSFTKEITFQKLEKEGIKNIGPAIEIMAEAEELIAHKNAVTLRLKALENE